MDHYIVGGMPCNFIVYSNLHIFKCFGTCGWERLHREPWYRHRNLKMRLLCGHNMNWTGFLFHVNRQFCSIRNDYFFFDMRLPFVGINHRRKKMQKSITANTGSWKQSYPLIDSRIISLISQTIILIFKIAIWLESIFFWFLFLCVRFMFNSEFHFVRPWHCMFYLLGMSIWDEELLERRQASDKISRQTVNGWRPFEWRLDWFPQAVIIYHADRWEHIYKITAVVIRSRKYVWMIFSNNSNCESTYTQWNDRNWSCFFFFFALQFVCGQTNDCHSLLAKANCTQFRIT